MEPQNSNRIIWIPWKPSTEEIDLLDEGRLRQCSNGIKNLYTALWPYGRKKLLMQFCFGKRMYLGKISCRVEGKDNESFRHEFLISSDMQAEVDKIKLYPARINRKICQESGG